MASKFDRGKRNGWLRGRRIDPASARAAPVALSDEEVRKVRTFWRSSGDFLGKPDAERDKDENRWLDRLYVPSDASQRVVAGTTRLVVGRKGCGKSAARIWASLNTSTDKALSFSISADEGLANHAEEFRTQGDAFGSPTAVWYRVFAFEILREVGKAMAGRALTSEAEIKVRQWVLSEGFAERDFGEKVIAGAKAILPAAIAAVPGAAVVPAPAGLLRGHDWRRPITSEVVAKALRGRRIVLFIDDFDNVYKPGIYAGASVENIRGALEAADRLSIRHSGPSVTLLLREDLWLLCRHRWHYLDKLGDVVELRWSDEQLKDWVARRLRLSVATALGRTIEDSLGLSFDAMWAIFFPAQIVLENRTESAGFPYVLRRTLYTPRDLQKFLKTVAGRAATWPADQDVFTAAEEDYSRDRLEFLINEFGHMCEGLSVCLHSFTGKAMEWMASELFVHLRGVLGQGAKLVDAVAEGDNEVALAKFLFRIGFLEVRYPDGDRFEVRDALRYPDHWKGIRRDDSIRWAVRSSFYRVLRSHRQ